MIRASALTSIALVAIGSVNCLASSTPAPLVGSNVTITFLPCRDHDVVNEVSVISDPSGKIVADAKMVRQPSGAEAYTATVPPGYYTVIAGVLPCSSSHNITVLPGKDRSIVMRGEDRLVMDADLGALAGTLPDDGVRVVADCIGFDKKTVSYAATVQAGAYYFDSMRAPMSCNVGVFTADRDAPPLFTMSRLNIAPFTSARRDITWGDMIR
jgi:hypothetical protein